MSRKCVLPIIILTALCVAAPKTFADTTQSYTGTLLSPDNGTSTFDSTDSFIQTLTLTSASNVTLQTYGFGGGTNAAGRLIAPGGTDPFVGLFSGTGNGATLINGGSLIDNYSNGCPPAGTVSDFGDTMCGDETFTFSGLAAGNYTILLSDGQFLPCALVGCGTTLGDGAADFTGGVFCNTVDVSTGTPCPNTSGAYALDVTVSGTSMPPPPTPEPSTFLLLAAGLFGVWATRKQSKPRSGDCT